MKKIFLFVNALLFTSFAFAQLNPVNWSFETQKVNDTEFDLVFTAKIDNGWYVYSQFIGDDGPIPTSFQFSENSNIEFVEKTQENGEVTKEGYDELFAMKLKKFGGTATFTQRIKVSNQADKISGYLEYMTCDEMRCLPPTEVNFEFELK